MSKIWFSSDFHINHGNITGPKVSKWKDGYRNFENTYTMNKEIFNNINKYVKSEDVLYFLGDFCFGGHSLTPQWRGHIACQTIHLLRGNHDSHIDIYKDSFTSINDVLTVKHGQHTFFMSHYKHAIWLGSHKGFIHLYGHSHSNAEKWQIGKSMDVGIDNAKKLLGEYRPFSIEEVINLMSKREIFFPDHHNGSTNIK